ncbi:hypothetical protein [Antarcticimicrobium luteum]|uniref:hypothetical protein n=1 Tax=Antarcticimicrobium luteum TaxID=2547397 RepID=UPI00140A41EA|nr:hypothetical protein [Antarcticimicrobium luteum]
MKAFYLVAAAAMMASPALAHVGERLHVHETDALPLMLGLATIAAAVGLGALVRVRNR